MRIVNFEEQDSKNQIEYTESEKSSVMNSIEGQFTEQQLQERPTSIKNSNTYVYNYGRHNEEPVSMSGPDNYVKMMDLR